MERARKRWRCLCGWSPGSMVNFLLSSRWNPWHRICSLHRLCLLYGKYIDLQSQEVGDETASAVIIAEKLLKIAMCEACKYVEEKLAVKVVEAVQAMKTTDANGEVKYPIKSINILEARRKSAKDSYLLNGFALNTGCATQGSNPC